VGDFTTMYPSGTVPAYPGGSSRYLPPCPLSGPVRPMSTTQRYQRSLIAPSTFGGDSRTTGPPRRSIHIQLYGVCVLGVRNTDFESIRVSKIGTVVLAGPSLRISLRL
jgi:hypothetical protein